MLLELILTFQLPTLEYLTKVLHQTDIGCGDYNSVIGMNKENSLKKFLKEKDFNKNFQQMVLDHYQV